MHKLLSCLLLLSLSTSILLAQSVAKDQLQELVVAEETYLHQLYLHHHTHPELSFKEKNTSARMGEELRKLDFEVTENFGGYGIVGILRNGDGPTIMVRADMDALPVVEETGLPYASTVTTEDDDGNMVGVMHACGHDIHMTVWTGTARLLSQLKQHWSGTLMFIGQPAEERAGGARAMIEDGLFEKFPVPDFALALHVSSSVEAGKVGVCTGYALANVDMMDITIYGEGGHGAYPHTAKDPVVLASRIILDLQTIVSREISPLEPAVVTVGSIHGGTKGNVIPDKVELKLTMRSYSEEVRNAIIEKIKRICKGVAMSAGLAESQYPKVHLRDEFTPSTYNDPALGEQLAKIFKEYIGDENVVENTPVMGGEDFGRYGRTEHKVPIQLYWLGTVSTENKKASEAGEIKLPPLHSSKFAPEYEPAIRTGVLTMTSAVLHLLNKE